MVKSNRFKSIFLDKIMAEIQLPMTQPIIPIRAQVVAACRKLLNEINRDPTSPAYGCCDRRFWSWKTVDFPEATFQRNLAALAWFLSQPEALGAHNLLAEWIKAGLLFTCHIQHRNGSFDQAYPFEQSYGATAFLLPDLIAAYQGIQNAFSPQQQYSIAAMFSKAASFLFKHSEMHAYISNHLAGSALALYLAGNILNKKEYEIQAQKIIDSILNNQSEEGWYPEYGGADPGYQSLCLYYLAQIYKIAPSAALKESFQKSLQFLQYFVHPDGTFGGEYGSRRTEVYYPGGIAILSDEFPLAASITNRMKASIEMGQTVNLTDIDMGNFAPLLNNTIQLLAFQEKRRSEPLPNQKKTLHQVFPQAGLLVHANPQYYAIVGISNGGVMKIFDKRTARIALDDCGWVGKILQDKYITTQMTTSENNWQWSQDCLVLKNDFYVMQHSLPGPFKFLLLRCMNLTIMRFHFLNEFVKKILVKMLISGKKSVPVNRVLEITFNEKEILIKEKFQKSASIALKRLCLPGKFTSIHMASARYFTPNQMIEPVLQEIDVDQFNQNNEIACTRMLHFA